MNWTTSFKSFENKSVYLSGTVLDYCRNWYDFLSQLKQKQETTARLLSQARNTTKVKELSETILKDKEQIELTVIAENIEWTDLLFKLKDDVIWLLSLNEESCKKKLLETTRDDFYWTLEWIEKVVPLVSKKNIWNFELHYKNVDEFVSKVIDEIKRLEALVDSLGAIPEWVHERLKNLKNEALSVYSLRKNIEDIREKWKVHWKAFDDFLDDFKRQMNAKDL